jgi:hypothetical protein
MASKDVFIPGVGMVNVPDEGDKEYIIPGAGFINEESISGGGVGEPPGPGDPSYGGLFFCHG